MHRIQWFDQQIRVGLYPNSNDLARQFEISKRQAQRDIEYLEISLRAPLAYIAKNRGYIYEDKTYVLPLLYMTDEEKKVLKYLSYRYRQYSYENASVVQRVANLLDRFTDEQEHEALRLLPVFHANPKLIQSMEQLSYAIRECLIVQMTYKDQEGESRIQIRPLKLVSRYNADYVIAFWDSNDKQKMFRLDNIKQVSVTSQTFERSVGDRFEWEQEGPLPATKPFTARIVMQQSLNGNAWSGYPIIPVQDFVYDVQFYDADSFLQHLLVSEWKQLLSPRWLISKMQSRCSEMLARLVIER
jgi:predicted DNA-binding transcriptional regulator YafY